ncbi:MAG: MBL fold metallo-hydrolase [Betaproteobacteria bacterium]|nr:MBL fold metallo-hydrolase [Betaproteobacteria bacterium]
MPPPLSALTTRSLRHDELSFPYPDAPAPAEWVALAEDVRWIRMPLPFALNHINLWLLRGDAGWTVVDTGINTDKTRKAWQVLLETHAPIEQIVITHYHPDHFGQAGWFVGTRDVPMLMTEAEYLTAHALFESTSGYDSDNLRPLYGAHGLDEERLDAVTTRPTSYRNVISPPPRTFRRIMHGDRLRLGLHEWEVIVGHGHAPEHASLYSRELGMLISGDMLLPKISTNVSVWSTQPDGDPVAQFLSSIRAYAGLPDDTLVLPSHGLPFRGIKARVRALEDHHAERLEELVAACSEPRTAAEIVPVLFRRELDVHQLFFAMGEAIAHLNYLFHRGRVRRTVGSDGAYRFHAPRP